MTLPMDILSQLATILQSDTTSTARTRSVLMDLYALQEYQDWLDEEQFDGRRFRIPLGFTFDDPRLRRHLESIRLVSDNILDVRINVSDGLVFITDGLFVPADFRVPPWTDESDHIVARTRHLGWDKWADAVVDLAVGCGITPIRLDVPDRFGFHYSLRGLGFALLNAALNERPFSLIGTVDIEKGVPLRGGGLPKNVLFVANMPFAIEPVGGTITPHAAGGENGYEKTLMAVKAISQFVSASRGTSVVRSVILAYSVGSQSRNDWVVEREARKLFASHEVAWMILERENLWRVNGKKEQPNPMPLSSLQLKADCRYYVRDKRLRDVLRQGYVRKELELKRQGFDSLAYGILEIDATPT